MAPATLPDSQRGLIDSALDHRAHPENSFTYTLNVSECVRDPEAWAS